MGYGFGERIVLDWSVSVCPPTGLSGLPPPATLPAPANRLLSSSIPRLRAGLPRFDKFSTNNDDE